MHTVRGSPTRVSARRNAWKDTALLEHCREIWQEAVENAPEQADHLGRVGPRNLEGQRVDALEKPSRSASPMTKPALVCWILPPSARPRSGTEDRSVSHGAGPRKRADRTWSVAQGRGRSLARFHAWIALQRARLDALWEPFERTVDRQQIRERELDQDRQRRKANPLRFTAMITRGLDLAR